MEQFKYENIFFKISVLKTLGALYNEMCSVKKCTFTLQRRLRNTNHKLRYVMGRTSACHIMGSRVFHDLNGLIREYECSVSNLVS